MSEMIFNANNFQDEVIKSDIPVLVDFFATWCGPCKMMAPSIEKAAQEYEGKVKVGKVDVDENPILAQSYNVSSVPTLLVIKNGEVTASKTGAVPYELLKAFIENAI